MIHNKDMKRLIYLNLFLFLSAAAFGLYPENEAEFLYNNNHGNQPVLFNYGNSHSYISGVNNTYTRDDGIKIRK